MAADVTNINKIDDYEFEDCDNKNNDDGWGETEEFDTYSKWNNANKHETKASQIWQCDSCSHTNKLKDIIINNDMKCQHCDHQYQPKKHNSSLSTASLSNNQFIKNKGVQSNEVAINDCDSFGSNEIYAPRISLESKIKEKYHIYSYGVRYFYWDYYKNNSNTQDAADKWSGSTRNLAAANEGHTIKDLYVAPKYNNLKDESLNNQICTIKLFAWNCLTAKAEKSIKYEHVRDIGFCPRRASAKCYDMHFGQLISTKHLIAIMTLNNYDTLRANFGQTFRCMPGTESIWALKERHRNYYYLGRYVRECVECFGMKCPKDANNISLHYGINTQCIFSSLNAFIKGPLYATRDYSLAANFSDNTGMILEFSVNVDDWRMKLNEGIDAYQRLCCFDFGWLNDYANEQTILFIGGINKLMINTIIEAPTGQNYSLYIKGLRQMTYNMNCGGNTFELKDLAKSQHEQQMVFRLLSHMLWIYYPNHDHAHEFKICPEYFKHILQSHCRAVRSIYFHEENNCRVQNAMFKYDNGWIKLNILLTIFPNTQNIAYNLMDNNEQTFIYENILAFLEKKHEFAHLRSIQIQISPLCRKDMELFIQQYIDQLSVYNWNIYIDVIKNVNEGLIGMDDVKEQITIMFTNKTYERCRPIQPNPYSLIENKQDFEKKLKQINPSNESIISEIQDIHFPQPPCPNNNMVSSKNGDDDKKQDSNKKKKGQHEEKHDGKQTESKSVSKLQPNAPSFLPRIPENTSTIHREQPQNTSSNEKKIQCIPFIPAQVFPYLPHQPPYPNTMTSATIILNQPSFCYTTPMLNGNVPCFQSAKKPLIKGKKRRKKKQKPMTHSLSWQPPQCIRARANVHISAKMTESIIPNKIKETFSDLFGYIDITTAMQFQDNKTVYYSNTDVSKILNYGFHDATNNETLYCIIKKQNKSVQQNHGKQWIMIDRLYTANELEQMRINKNTLPTPSRLSRAFIFQLRSAVDIKNILLTDSTKTETFIKRTKWHTVNVFNRYNTKRRLSLSLSKEEFIEELKQYIHSIGNNITLVPLMMFDNVTHWIEHMLIIRIDINKTIGISLVYYDNTIKATGIHLDKTEIYKQHISVLPQHDQCNCLSSFDIQQSDVVIDDIQIGNPYEKENKINALHNNITELQREKAELQNLVARLRKPITLNFNSYHQQSLVQNIPNPSAVIMSNNFSSNEDNC